MAEKQYWLAGPNAEKAVVEGTAERDRLFPHGWRETSEPVDGDFVWMSHPDPDIGNPGLLPWSAREYWQGIGWEPSAPPEPVNPALDPVLNDKAALADETPAEAKKPASKARSTTAEHASEKDS